MPEQFYTILTQLGQAELAAAIANNTQVSLTQMAVGDGNGNYYEPSSGQTALVHEVYRAGISAIATDPNNPNRIVCEFVIPATTGGWHVREVGIFSLTGNLFAIGKVPVTYKPQFSEGAGKDLVIKVILEVSNASAVTLRVDPSVVLASKKYVRDYVDDSMEAHSPVRDSYRNLMIKNNAANPNHQLDILADEIILQDTNGNSLRVSAVNHTVDITVSGVNGLDTGTKAPSTWYHIWEIAKADGTKAGLLSASATSPTMPSGYTYRAYLGAVYNNSSNNFITIRQINSRVVIFPVTVLQNGTATSYTLVSLSITIPPTAKKVTGALVVYNSGDLFISSSNNEIGIKHMTNPYGNYCAAPFSQVILTPQTIFYRVWSSNHSGTINVSGWEY